MFFVFNKDKIISCIIAAGTVVLLFLLATTFKEDYLSIQTAGLPSKLLPIYSVNTEEKKVALTINCAWNDRRY